MRQTLVINFFERSWIYKRFYSTTNSSSSCDGIDKSPIMYCYNNVKKFDLENFSCTAFLPKDLIPCAFAIRAFNVETGMVQDVVTEVITGLMRLQFWNEAIDKIYLGNIPDHPICIELAEAIRERELSKMYFKRIISARKNLLQSKTFQSVNDIEQYSDSTNTVIYLLLLEAAGIKSVDSDHAGSHLGKAQGFVNLLRGIHYYTRKSIVTIPPDLLIKYKVSQENVLRHSTEKSMKDLTFEIASHAHTHLQHVQELKKKLDCTSKLILLPEIPIRNYLDNLRSLDFDIFHPKLRQKNHALTAKLWWTKIFY